VIRAAGSGTGDDGRKIEKPEASKGGTMTEMVWELFVAGLLLYGLAFLGIAAVSGRGGARSLEIPDYHDAPIFVTRRSSRATTATVTTRTGMTRTTTA
jgi:hypothetical protein